jgi:localization factor PodJL
MVQRPAFISRVEKATPFRERRRDHRWIMATETEFFQAMTADAEKPRSMRDALMNPSPKTASGVSLPEESVPAQSDEPAQRTDVALAGERRLAALEHVVADIAHVVEQHEIAMREREDALTSVAQTVIAFRDRMDAWEKDRELERAEHAKEISDLRGLLAEMETRLKTVEAQKALPPPVAAATVAPSAPASSAALPVVWAKDAEPPRIQAVPPPPPVSSPVSNEVKDSTQAYLTAARRAAIASAAAPARKPAAAQPGRRLSRAQYVMAGCAAPLVVAAAASFALSRHQVSAEAVPANTAFKPAHQDGLAPQQSSLAPPPDLIIAPPADPAPGEFAAATLGVLQEKAQAGDIKAARDIGLKYLAGDHVAVNEEEAARWLLRASYRGEAGAEYWLGTLYSRGRGVPADPFQANHWYGASAKQGNANAMHRLGIANFEGLGTENNPVEAVHWFTEAAARGLVDSQFDLAVLYERGTGVAQSLADAYKWYAVAAAQGDKEAASRASALAKVLKPEELAEAGKAAAAFKPETADDQVASAAPKSSGD